MIYTQFCDTLDPAAVQVIIDLFKGNPLDARVAALAAINVESYVLGKMIDPVLTPAPVAHAHLDDDALLQSLFAHAQNPALALGFDWSGIFAMLLKLLPLIFQQPQAGKTP